VKDADRNTVVKYWIDKAKDTLENSRLNLNKGFLDGAVNRLYYSAFYVLMAYATLKGEKYKKHKGIKSFLSERIIKQGLLDKQYAKLYNRLYLLREKADYTPLSEFTYQQVEELLSQTEEFITEMERLIKKEMEKE